MATVEVGEAQLPDRLDVTHLAGKPFELSVPVLNADATGVDFSAVASARAQVRATVDGEVVLHVFSTENDPADIEITDVAGDAVLVLSADSTVTTDWQATWPGRDGQAVVWWDVEITDGDGEPHQITRPGTFTLIHQVTR